MAQSDQKTVQLRRYEMVQGTQDDFKSWWRGTLVPLREKFGFSAEFGYMNEDESEFLWAVSYPGDLTEFKRIEAEYMASDDRKAVFDDLPKRVEAMYISMATPVI